MSEGTRGCSRGGNRWLGKNRKGNQSPWLCMRMPEGRGGGMGVGFNQARFGQVNVTREEADEGVEDVCQGVIIMTYHGSKLGEGTEKRGKEPWITGAGRAV